MQNQALCGGRAAAVTPTGGQEVFRGHVSLEGAPGIVDVEFSVPIGASKEQKDLAFIEALCQVADIDLAEALLCGRIPESVKDEAVWFDAPQGESERGARFCLLVSHGDGLSARQCK